jgi:hypothetical protein
LISSGNQCRHTYELISISTITYKFIEKPGIVFGNKLIEKMENGEKIYLIELMKRLKWNGEIAESDQKTW